MVIGIRSFPLFFLCILGFFLKGAVELKPHPADKNKPTDSWYSLVHSLVRENKVDQLRKELDKYQDQNISFLLGSVTTPEMVRYLIEKGGVAVKKYIQEKFLIASILQQQADLGEDTLLSLVKEFLSFGANPRLACANYEPIHCAAQDGHSKIVSLLLEKGVPVDALSTGDNKKQTALHQACYYSQIESIKTLVAAGTDVWKINAEGKSPFELLEYYSARAVSENVIKEQAIIAYMLDLLGREVFTRKLGDDQLTLFEQACKKRSYCLSLYLQKATQEDLCKFKDFYAEGTLFHTIVCINQEAFKEEIQKSVAIALAKGVDCNAKDKKGNTPLHCAAMGGWAASNITFLKKILRVCTVEKGKQ